MIDDKRSNVLDALMGGLEVEITVGIHESEGSKGHGGVSNAELGSIHEFGLGVPSRPFVRGYFDENEEEISRLINEAAGDILDGEDPSEAADLVALQLESGVKQRILDGLSPEASEAVKRKRGEGAIPLVDTSQMLGSIRGKSKVL